MGNGTSDVSQARQAYRQDRDSVLRPWYLSGPLGMGISGACAIRETDCGNVSPRGTSSGLIGWRGADHENTHH